MGRIAEALKKAEHEREEQLRLGLADAAAAEETAKAPPGEPAAVAESQPIGRISRLYAGLGVQGLPGMRGLKGATAGKASAEIIGPPPAWEVHSSVVCVHERWSSVAEQYRAIRTWLLRRNPVAERSSLAITSSIQGEGKSVTTANLAVSMAEVRHLKVLAIDADFRGSSLAKLFMVPNSPGLADVLAGRATLASAVVKTPLDNLSILPAGLCQELNPTELLSSPTAAKAFDEIRERYHYALVDTPPVQKLSDVGVIGALCSGILMVVRMHRTPSNLVRQSLHWLQSNNLNVVGCIAAACNAKDARHMYRESYEREE